VTVQHGTARLPGEIELPYVESGDRDGMPVVLLHAYADSWRSFETVLTFLSPRIRAVAPTQRGHGDAAKPAAGYAVEDFARDLLAFLDELALARRRSLRRRVPRSLRCASLRTFLTGLSGWC
jgi:pimeloyl-ACP methyl ester carboxylesterase